MIEHIKKRHNKTILLYHLVFPVRYRRKVISPAVKETIRVTCLEISYRYEINFVEIGLDVDHVHFLIQSVPSISVQQIVTKVKSLTAREIFSSNPEVKRELWGGKFWTSGYYANSVSNYGNAEVIGKYVKEQGGNYEKIYDGQISLFE